MPNRLLLEALDCLKWKIERLEEDMEQIEDKWKRKQKEHEIERELEWAIRMIEYAYPGEVDQEVVDWFFNRIPERPDITRFKQRLLKKNKRFFG